MCRVMNKKSEEDFFTCFKRIRNRLKNYSRNEIFDACMKNIIEHWGLELFDLVKENKPTPMNLFLLMKWGMCYAEHPSNARKQFSLDAFKQIYADIVDLPVMIDMLQKDDPFALTRFIRANAPHQLYYQTDTGLYGLAVLETIINKIGISYDSNKTMLSILGITIEEFIDLQLAILKIMAIEPKYRSYRIDFYKYLFNTYSTEKIQTFLDYMSNDYATIIDFMLEDHQYVGNPEYECTLLTPLYKKPLFRKDKQYYPYHVALLNTNIEFGVYDTLKKYDAPNFCSAFGVGFEEYVSNSISYVTKNYLREKEIREITHKDRACDFIIPENDSTIFIEAKSAEMFFLTRQKPSKQYLQRTLRNSLISGYKQIITLTHYLHNQKHEFIIGKELFGIIITYKNLMLGHPDEIWNEFMQDFMNSSLSNNIMNNMIISPYRIFVTSSLEFDYLLSYSHKYNKSLSNCLKTIETNNTNPQTRRFFLYDNFDEDLKFSEITNQSEAFKSIKNRIAEALILGQKGETNNTI